VNDLAHHRYRVILGKVWATGIPHNQTTKENEGTGLVLRIDEAPVWRLWWEDTRPRERWLADLERFVEKL